MNKRRFLTLYALIMMIFLLAPLVCFLPISFSSASFLSYPIPGFSLRWYAKVLQPTPWLFALRNSLIVGVCSTAIATLLGTLAAFAVAKSKSVFSNIFMGLIVSPMIAPAVVTAVGMYFMFAKIGLLATFPGLIVAHVVLGVPFVVVTVVATLENFDGRQWQAAANLGAPPLYAFFTVILPQISHAVVAGAVFCFVTSFDEVVVATFITGPAQRTLPRQMFEGIRDSIDPSILAISALLLMVTVAGIIAAAVFRRGLPPE